MKFTEIDLNNLDTILQTHAFEFQEATETLPELRRAMTDAKLALERKEAELYLAIRAGFEQSGHKFTESKITATVKAELQYSQTQAVWLDARMAHDKVDHLREAFMQREASIKNLVSLFIAQYWSLSGVETVPKASPATADGGKAFKARA